MRYIFGFLCFCALVALPLVGCGGSNGGDGGSAGTAGTGGGGGVETAELRLTATEGDGNILGTRLEGVEFCETDIANCTTSDANGQATLEMEVPADGRISYTYSKDGYMPGLRTDVVDEEFNAFIGEYGNFNITDETMTDRWAGMMSPYPMEGTGWVSVNAFVSDFLPSFLPVVGATFELVGATGKGYYDDPSGEPSLVLTETGISGGGGFIEVAPGEVEIRFGGTATNCVVLKGWPGSEANTIRMPVKVGFVTWGSMRCDAP
ncbi:MAG: hypothetical protein JRE82_12985 [Deltaproteobacteria bacterium]|nr:hypothetical protein [Deltaproteobacteria bacterium]